MFLPEITKETHCHISSAKISYIWKARQWKMSLLMHPPLILPKSRVLSFKTFVCLCHVAMAEWSETVIFSDKWTKLGLVEPLLELEKSYGILECISETGSHVAQAHLHLQCSQGWPWAFNTSTSSSQSDGCVQCWALNPGLQTLLSSWLHCETINSENFTNGPKAI